ncbi:MAG TPA: HEAT repeat domain-containing protein [Tepidisphaeraceae bacterium]|nr:HEAT repeat domain-containing protein [Tepidisphaeraceae bacterium]
MAKARGADELLNSLSGLRGTPLTDAGREFIAKGLASRVNFAAAKAAELVREFKLAGHCADLQDAFGRFLKAGDKGCAALTAAARAALELECPAEELFRAGIRHVQMEGSFGPPVDVAAELRGLSALGLVMVRAKGFMNHLADLLADPEPTARIGAIRALAYSGREDGALLLRFKASGGDEDPAVIGECLTALLQLQPRDALPLVERFLDSDEESLCEEAALALGSSKAAGAFELLKARYFPHADPQFRRVLLTAMATQRSAAASEFLTSLVGTEPAPLAAEVLKTMRIYRNDSAVRQALSQIVQTRNDPSLSAVFQREFES